MAKAPAATIAGFGFGAIGLVALAATLLTAVRLTQAAPVRDYAVEVSATVQESPPCIDFSWTADLSALEYVIYKKSVGDTAWTGPIAILAGVDTSFTDTDVAVGHAYEYSFRKTPGFIADTVAVAAGDSLTFTINDSWGDGICCSNGLGSYTVSGCDVVYTSGGKFRWKKSTSFVVGTPGNPCSELVVAITLDIFGQETTWRLTDGRTGGILAQGGPYAPPEFGHILAGIRAPALEDPGTVLLLVSEPLAGPLAAEIKRLELDMIRDGYGVCRHDIPDGTPVPTVKDRIVNECGRDPAITTLFLLGHIAVPYSGDVLSGHLDQNGAWPADCYYGELDGVWTDSSVSDTSANRPENHNVPGDGKFDQTFLPSDVDLQVGRADLSHLPAFALGEVGLVQRYLDKNHAFRSGQVDVPRRAMIQDRLGELYGSAYSCTGWRNFTAMFGSAGVESGNWIPGLQNDAYLCALGCAGGSYTSCAGVVSTSDFATLNFYAVFTMLMGSYFGDWDTTNNLMRAALASAGYPLTCFWAGCPPWHLHHMALGYPAGYSARLTQNNHTLYTIGYGGRQIHTALMGDPTLNPFVVRPPGNLHLEELAGPEIRLTWTASSDSVVGYHVYRAESLSDRFVRVTSDVVADTSYVDSAPLPDWAVYMVRAVKLETTGSGTYFDLSAGAIDSIGAGAGVDPNSRQVWLRNSPNPFGSGTDITFGLARPARVTLQIHDVAGRLVRVVDASRLKAGRHTLAWNGTDAHGRPVASGVYFLSLDADGATLSRKAIKLR